MSRWIKFNPLGVNLPKEKEDVILRFEEDKDRGVPFAYVVGYLRRWEDKNIFFVTPGFDRGKRKMTHWSRCLNNFTYLND